MTETEPKIEGVPLRDYLEAMFAADRRERDIAAAEREKAASALRIELEARIVSQGVALADALKAQEKLAEEKEKRLAAIRDADQVAIVKAFTAQEVLAHKHNDLIRLGERKEATYATKKEIEDVLGQQKSLVDLRFAELARERASLVIRFDEFRSAMAADTGGKVTRELFDEHQANLVDRFEGFTERVGQRLERVETDLHRKEGGEEVARRVEVKAGVTIGQVIGVVTVVIAIAAILVGAFT